MMQGCEIFDVNVTIQQGIHSKPHYKAAEQK